MKQYIFNIGNKAINLHIIVLRNILNGRLILQLQEIETEELFDEITSDISLIGFRSLNYDEIIVKTYEWLANLDQWLVENKVATHTGEHLTKNDINVPVMKLTPEFLEENKAAITAPSME